VWAIALTGSSDAFCSGLDLDQDRDAADADGTMAIRRARAATDHLADARRCRPLLAGGSESPWARLSLMNRIQIAPSAA
jgi:hypothetical protein